MMTNDESRVLEAPNRTAQALTEDLKNALRVLDWTPGDLMNRMISLGDYRSPETILRGINRALEGQIKVSGELLALVHQIVRFKRRLNQAYGDAVWTQLGDGSHTTKIEDFTITLIPKSKGRWQVNLIHVSGYSPPWPRWQNSVETAKNMAFIILDNAQNSLLEFEEEQVRRSGN